MCLKNVLYESYRAYELYKLPLKLNPSNSTLFSMSFGTYQVTPYIKRDYNHQIYLAWLVHFKISKLEG